jgi:hypothetical protein
VWNRDYHPALGRCEEKWSFLLVLLAMLHDLKKSSASQMNKGAFFLLG